MTEKQNILNYLTHKPYEGKKPFVFFTMNQGMGPIMNVELPACERGMGGTGYDVFGVHWTKAAEASHYTPGQKPRYTDIDTWREELKIPNIDRLDWDSFKSDADKVDRDKYVVTFTSLMGPFERTTCLTSFEDCLVNLISEPEEFSDLIGTIADYKIALLNKASSIIKPEVINVHDDWGTAASTFMNPQLWRQVIKPHIQRIYDCVRDNGALVCQHSCGKITPLVGDIVEMGCTAWEAQADCNDIAALNKEYGDRLIILGGFDLGAEGAPPVGGGDKGEKPPMQEERYKPYSEIPTFLFD